mgnify:CR=1 FL=1
MAETERPQPKFHKGQIVAMKGLKKQLPFRILDVMWRDDDNGWFYAWNRRNYAAESMIRALTTEGPWAWESVGEKSNYWCLGTVDPPISGRVAERFDGETQAFVRDFEIVDFVCEASDGKFADADFIAHARTDIPLLCEALEQAWRERDEARQIKEAEKKILLQEIERRVALEQQLTEMRQQRDDFKGIAEGLNDVLNGRTRPLADIEAELRRRGEKES